MKLCKLMFFIFLSLFINRVEGQHLDVDGRAEFEGLHVDGNLDFNLDDSIRWLWGNGLTAFLAVGNSYTYLEGAGHMTLDASGDLILRSGHDDFRLESSSGPVLDLNATNSGITSIVFSSEGTNGFSMDYNPSTERLLMNNMSNGTLYEYYFDRNGLGIGGPSSEILTVFGRISIKNGDSILLANDQVWKHYNGTQRFGNTNSQNDVLVASGENSSESAGFYGGADAATIWSPGDPVQGSPAAHLYILDEDDFDASDSNPYNNGALVAYLNASGVWNVSDADKKENIRPITQALDKVRSLSGYAYTYKQNNEESSKENTTLSSVGVLAQELEQVIPEAVQSNDSGERFVNYAMITPILIEAIKEQQKHIENLEQRLNHMEDK